LKIPRFLDNQLTEGGKVCEIVSLTRQQQFTPHWENIHPQVLILSSANNEALLI
jgi:hypothetical protein